MSEAPVQTYTINGIKVNFPCKAYPSQLSMMAKIIKGLDQNQNCLLESPTGSGKSLALLCSALAWQQHEQVKLEKQREAEANSCCSCKCSDKPPSVTGPTSEYFYTAANQVPPSPSSVNAASSSNAVADIEDGDFKPDLTKFRYIPGANVDGQGNPVAQSPIQQGPGWLIEAQTSTPTCQAQTECSCQCENTSPVTKKRIPKIYFGTRTHKQIAQITRELGRTAYKHVRMCILSSREHTCIDPEVSRGSHKNEECKNKREGPGCRFFDKVRKISHRTIRNNGLDTAWNLEQFVSLCQRSSACPYYGSRQLKDGAEIIFCPYNYLVDPLVRQAMEIQLKGQVVILDEAHNIEDSSRDAASFSTSQAKIREAQEDLKYMIESGIKIEEHGQLHTMMNSFDELINRNIDHLEGADYENESRVWTGQDIVAQLKFTGVGPDDMDRLGRCFATVTDDDGDAANKGPDDPKLRPQNIQTLEGLFMVLRYIYKDNLKFLDDYRVAIVRSMVYQNVDTNNRWMGKKRRAHMEPTVTYNLNFWCLNPAVAFSDISEVVKSVILTSGTLSPMNTFQSELAAPFPIQLEANHVITNSQVWVGTISKGPRGAPLLGSYQNSESFAYQDDLGEIVLNICQTVPFGVLCFLPSYKYLEKLSRRWKSTNLWSKLGDHKVVMTEPRAGDKEDFETVIKDYYEIVEHHTQMGANGGDRGVTGALFFAVCRGKVSEGLDFADNNARAVIAVGIPFPNIKDVQIELKKQYNDQRSSTRGLLKGRDWYEIQAFRAINQALGRCIRHRGDWGALILVDERYAKNPQKYIQGLSRWVRHRVQYYTSFQMAHRSLENFTKDRLENPVPVNPNVSVLSSQSVLGTQGVPQSPGASPDVRHVHPEDSIKRRSASPTVDAGSSGVLPGTAIPNTPQLLSEMRTAVQDKTPRAFRMSQAGGFLPTQSATQNTPTPIVGRTVNLLMPTQETMEVTQVQAGHSTQAAVTIDLAGSSAVLEFNPPMASTQVSGTPVISRFLSKPPVLPPMSPICTGSHDNGAVKGKLNFGTPMSNVAVVQKNEVGHTNSTPDPKHLKPTANAAKVKSMLDQSRSKSPTLFDSDEDDEPMKSDMQASTVCNISHAKGGVRTVNTGGLNSHVVVNSDDEDFQNASTRKPLFKKPNTGNSSSATPGSERKSKRVNSRLSRSFQKQELDTTTDEALEGQDSLLRDPDSTVAEVKVEDDNRPHSDGTLNTKRPSSRNKRRRSGGLNVSSGKKPKGVEFDEEDDFQENKPTQALTIICPCCKAELSKVTDYRFQSHRPAFVKAMRAAGDKGAARSLSGDMATVDESQLADDKLCPIKSQSPELNCYLSAEDGAVVQFLACPSCATLEVNANNNKPCRPVGAHVVILLDKHNPRLGQGQVWFLPGCLQKQEIGSAPGDNGR